MDEMATVFRWLSNMNPLAQLGGGVLTCRNFADSPRFHQAPPASSGRFLHTVAKIKGCVLQNCTFTGHGTAARCSRRQNLSDNPIIFSVRFILIRVAVDPEPTVWAQGGNIPWVGHQYTTGDIQTLGVNLEQTVHPQACFGRREETHGELEKLCSHSNPRSGSNRGAWSWEAAMLPIVPPCHAEKLG